MFKHGTSLRPSGGGRILSASRIPPGLFGRWVPKHELHAQHPPLPFPTSSTSIPSVLHFHFPASSISIPNTPRLHFQCPSPQRPPPLHFRFQPPSSPFPPHSTSMLTTPHLHAHHTPLPCPPRPTSMSTTLHLHFERITSLPVIWWWPAGDLPVIWR